LPACQLAGLYFLSAKHLNRINSVKKFVTTLKNIWSIEELRNKIVFTLLLLFVYRLGSFIVLPGIDPNKLANLTQSTKSGMLGLLDAFVGGAFPKHPFSH
jgi:preprotein translocase subunit SecY